MWADLSCESLKFGIYAYLNGPECQSAGEPQTSINERQSSDTGYDRQWAAIINDGITHSTLDISQLFFS